MLACSCTGRRKLMTGGRAGGQGGEKAQSNRFTRDGVLRLPGCMQDVDKKKETSLALSLQAAHLPQWGGREGPSLCSAAVRCKRVQRRRKKMRGL